MRNKLLEFGKNEDYATLREWCLTISSFVSKAYPEMSHVEKEICEGIEKIDKTKNVRYMRIMYKEMNWLVGDGFLPDPLMNQLNLVLTEKFKYNLVDMIAADNVEIRKIIKRGRICNDRELELVRNREEAIYADDSQWDYAETLRKLMLDYESMKSKR